MSQSSSNDLSQELAAMSDVFSDLGERLLGAARHLHSPGTPPPDQLIADLAASRRNFLSLRDRARQRAEEMRVPHPTGDSLDTLQGLTTLLDNVAEAELRQSQGEETRARSLAPLDRIEQLSHSGEPDFAPLRDVRDRARQLRNAIAEADWSDLPAEADRLAGGDHPFVHLLALVQDRDALNDDDWARFHESVGETFGRPLAAAAARSKLVLAPAPSAPESRPQSGGGDKGSGRKNLGKATPSPR